MRINTVHPVYYTVYNSKLEHNYVINYLFIYLFNGWMARLEAWDILLVLINQE